MTLRWWKKPFAHKTVLWDGAPGVVLFGKAYRPIGRNKYIRALTTETNSEITNRY